MTSSVRANGKKKEHTATPYITPAKKSGPRKKVNTVSQAVDVILKESLKADDDENISTTPKTKTSGTLKNSDVGKRDMSWLDEDAKPTRTCSSIGRRSPPINVEEDWDRPLSKIAKGSDTVIPVSSKSLAISLRGRSQSSDRIAASTQSIDQLWKAVEKTKSENKVRKDYSGVPLLPIAAGNSIGINGTSLSREGLLSPPVSRYKGSVNSVSGDDSDVDGSSTESRASSVMSVSVKGPVPTPRPPSNRKTFLLRARPQSTDIPSPSSSDSYTAHKALIDSGVMDERSSSSQADDMETPTFAQHPESPRVPRQRYRVEPTVSSLVLKEIETDLKGSTRVYIYISSHYIKFLIV